MSIAGCIALATKTSRGNKEYIDWVSKEISENSFDFMASRHIRSVTRFADLLEASRSSMSRWVTHGIAGAQPAYYLKMVQRAYGDYAVLSILGGDHQEDSKLEKMIKLMNSEQIIRTQKLLTAQLEELRKGTAAS